MSEQENKVPTAVEIERALRERRQQELEQASTDSDKGDAAEPDKRLGIDKLKKSRKGLVVIIVAFLLLAIGVCFYYVPSIIRAMSSSEEKPATKTVPTGTVKRQTGLSDDIDPFNQSQRDDSKEAVERDTGKNEQVKAEEKPQNMQHSYSRALDVAYGGSSGSGSSNSVNQSQAETNDQDGDAASTEKTVELVKNGASVSLSEIKRVPYDPNLFIPENTAIKCSLDRRFISDLAGKLVCTINEDVYSANRNVKLIDKGTAAYLMYKSGTFRHGQGAVFIMATKLRTRKEPFIDIPLIDTQAAGALGEAGASGWIDTHFSDRFLGL